MTPKLSIILPAYNEADLISETLQDLTLGLGKLRIPAEILVCENGSTDKTFQKVAELAQKNSSIRLFHQKKPSYGTALKLGIEKAEAEKIVIFNVDFYDLVFVRKAVKLLDDFDFVIGSKNLPQSRDLRPFNRKLVTKTFNFLLKVFFGFTGSDTHGIKAIKKSKIARILTKCKTEGEIFDTELVLRAQKEGLKFAEIHVSVTEIRPSRYSLISRIPKTFFDLITLVKVLQ